MGAANFSSLKRAEGHTVPDGLRPAIDPGSSNTRRGQFGKRLGCCVIGRLISVKMILSIMQQRAQHGYLYKDKTGRELREDFDGHMVRRQQTVSQVQVI